MGLNEFLPYNDGDVMTMMGVKPLHDASSATFSYFTPGHDEMKDIPQNCLKGPNIKIVSRLLSVTLSQFFAPYFKHFRALCSTKRPQSGTVGIRPQHNIVSKQCRNSKLASLEISVGKAAEAPAIVYLLSSTRDSTFLRYIQRHAPAPKLARWVLHLYVGHNGQV